MGQRKRILDLCEDHSRTFEMSDIDGGGSRELVLHEGGTWPLTGEITRFREIESNVPDQITDVQDHLG